jgi:hypothetical protein
MQTQQAEQVQPRQPVPRKLGLMGALRPQAALGAGGMPTQQSVTASAGGSTTLAPALANSLLSVFAPLNAPGFSSSYTAGVSSYIPNSGNASNGQPYQFILDGNPGVLTLTWTDPSTSQPTTYTVNIQGQYGTLPATPTCPAGQRWNGNACVAQIVFQQPPLPPPTCPTGQHWDASTQRCVNTITFPYPTLPPPPNTGGTQHNPPPPPPNNTGSSGPSSTTGSSTSTYIAVGAAALILAAGGYALYVHNQNQQAPAQSRAHR